VNILTINKFFWRKGGSEAVFFNEMDLLRQYGHQVVPFSMKNQNNIESPYEKYFIEEVDYGRPGVVNKLRNASKALYSFDARSKMTQLLTNHSFDIAHFHIFQHQISPSVFGPLTRKGVPLVLTLHDLKPICPNYKMYVGGQVCESCKGRKFYQAALKRCNKGSILNSAVNMLEMYLHYSLGYYQNVHQFVAVSRFYKKKMIDFGFPEEQVTYIPNMIELDASFLSKDDAGYALYFGRLSEEKDVDTLIMAMKMVPDLKLIIAGTGPDEPLLKALAMKYEVNNVDFVGFQSGDDLKQLISQASFTVLPSKWYENCPMSVLESYAFGKPVIGARIGGIPELIEDNVDGFHFSPENKEALAERLNQMVSIGKIGRQEMGMIGYEKVKRDHSPEQHYHEIMKVYQSYT
jgi:glycosyltransferase involved in cell wall biosynthesis